MTIKGGKIEDNLSENTYDAGDTIKITADPAPKGMRFKCWYISDGRIDRSATTVVRGKVNEETAWWYVKNGKVDTSYTGFAENENGWWYCEGGQVNFRVRASIKGTIDGETRWWNVIDGKVQTVDGQ